MTNHRTMIVSFMVALLIGAAPTILIGSELMPGQSSEKAVAPGDGVENRLPHKVPHDRFSARVLEVKEGQLRVLLPELKEERAIHLEPSLLRTLGKISDRTYTMNIRERRLPSGLTGAIALQDQRGLYAILESIRDHPLLAPEERMGIQVEPQPNGSRTLVYESDCAIVYNIPTLFIIGDQHVILQAFESKGVTIGGHTYLLSLQTSRWTVEKQCPALFEGAHMQVDYAVVREQ